MKILQVSNRVPWPLNEGGTIGIYNYTRAYHQLGHEVTLYCLDGDKHNTPIEEAKEELSKYANVCIHSIDTRVKPIPALLHLLQNKSYNVSRFDNAEFKELLYDLLKRETFDVVQLEGTFAGPNIDVIRDNHRGLVALRMHNVEYEIWDRLAHNATNSFKKYYLNKLSSQLKSYEAQLLQNVDIVVPVTDDDSDKFRLINPDVDYLTIPAGIDLEYWKFAPSNTINNWYHIGSMQWHANEEAVNWFLRDIHSLILAIDANYQFHLAGKGIQKNTFKSLDRVSVNENVPSAYHFVRDLDVCVVPLKSGSGIRLKILEAMATGKLVISTTIGAQGIGYISNEHLLIADTPSDFVIIYQQLLDQKIDWKTIVKNARKLVEDEYSTEALATKQLDTYSKRLQ